MDDLDETKHYQQAQEAGDENDVLSLPDMCCDHYERRGI